MSSWRKGAFDRASDKLMDAAVEDDKRRAAVAAASISNTENAARRERALDEFVQFTQRLCSIANGHRNPGATSLYRAQGALARFRPLHGWQLRYRSDRVSRAWLTDNRIAYIGTDGTIARISSMREYAEAETFRFERTVVTDPDSLRGSYTVSTLDEYNSDDFDYALDRRAERDAGELIEVLIGAGLQDAVAALCAVIDDHTGAKTSAANRGRLSWRFKVPGDRAYIHGAVVQDDVLFVVASKSPSVVYALEAQTGVDTGRRISATELVWCDLQSEAGSAGRNAEIVHVTPLVVDAGSVFFGLPYNHSICALASDTLAVRWVRRLHDRVEACPSVANGNIIVSDNTGHVYALEAASGNTVWKHAGGVVHSSFDTMITPYKTERAWSTAAVSKDLVVLTHASGWVHCLRAQDGRPQWVVPNESRSQGIPLIDGSSVYVDGHPGTIEKRDLFSGELIWKHETDSYATTSVILSGDFVLFGGSSAASEQISLYCLDKGTGSRVWTKSGGIGGFETDPVVHGGSVFWSDCDARLSAFDSHGDVAWQYRRSTSTAFVPFGEFVLAGSGDEVLCFNA